MIIKHEGLRSMFRLPDATFAAIPGRNAMDCCNWLLFERLAIGDRLNNWCGKNRGVRCPGATNKRSLVAQGPLLNDRAAGRRPIAGRD